MAGGFSSLVALVLSSCMLVGGQTSCSLRAAQFSLSTVTVSAESVGGSTPGARVTWSTTLPPECVTSVRVEFRNSTHGSVVATYTTTNTSQTEVIQTGLQCATNYYIAVVVTGETSDGLHLRLSSRQVLVGAIPILFGVRAEVTADNTSISVSWKWSCQGVLDLVRVHYQPEGGSLMMYAVDNTTATSATLPYLQCSTEYTIWVHASRCGQINRTIAPRMVSLPARAPPTPTEVTVQFISASSVRVAWQWAISGPAPNCFNTTTVTYRPEGGGESSLQLSDPAATEATLTDLQNTCYTINVVATAGEHRSEGIAFIQPQGTPSMCQEVSDDPGASSDPGTQPSSNLAVPTHGTASTSTSAVAGVAVTAVLVLLVVAVVQSAVIWYQRRSIARIKGQTQSATAKTTEIPLKECSAYGQIDQGGGEREENYIYEHPQ